jgi:hypothetical protein
MFALLSGWHAQAISSDQWSYGISKKAKR